MKGLAKEVVLRLLQEGYQAVLVSVERRVGRRHVTVERYVRSRQGDVFSIHGGTWRALMRHVRRVSTHYQEDGGRRDEYVLR